MMWDEVMRRVIAEIETDAILVSIYGGDIRMAGTGSIKVPSLEWSLLSDVENELWAPMLIQFDLWTYDAELCRRSEFRLRSLYHKELPIIVSGLLFWMRYDDGQMLATPDRSGFVGRALRFRFTPLRRQYARVDSPSF